MINERIITFHGTVFDAHDEHECGGRERVTASLLILPRRLSRNWISDRIQK